MKFVFVFTNSLVCQLCFTKSFFQINFVTVCSFCVPAHGNIRTHSDHCNKTGMVYSYLGMNLVSSAYCIVIKNASWDALVKFGGNRRPFEHKISCNGQQTRTAPVVCGTSGPSVVCVYKSLRKCSHGRLRSVEIFHTLAVVGVVLFFARTLGGPVIRLWFNNTSSI